MTAVSGCYRKPALALARTRGAKADLWPGTALVAQGPVGRSPEPCRAGAQAGGPCGGPCRRPGRRPRLATRTLNQKRHLTVYQLEEQDERIGTQKILCPFTGRPVTGRPVMADPLWPTRFGRPVTGTTNPRHSSGFANPAGTGSKHFAPPHLLGPRTIARQCSQGRRTVTISESGSEMELAARAQAPGKDWPAAEGPVTERPEKEWKSNSGGTNASMRSAAVPTLVQEAKRGNPEAWGELVARFGLMIAATGRRYRLTPADVAELQQTTWLRLVENIHRVEQPERIGGWLATTARRESLQLVRKAARYRPGADQMLANMPDNHLPEPDAAPHCGRTRSDAARRLGTFAASMPRRSSRASSAMTPLVTRNLSALLQMPVGSIGPTRARCLQHLRRLVEGEGVSAA